MASGAQHDQRSESCQFTRLSTELVTHILDYVEPMDILDFRQTCRAFHSITHSKILWTKALNRLCERHGLFKPTFPTDRMSLPELEHAATSPNRFVETINCYEDEHLEVLPFQSRVHPLRPSAESVVVSCDVDTFALIPGGRFLLTNGRHEIVLWDLGYNSKQYLKPWPLSADHGYNVGADGVMRAVAPTPDGKQLLVAAETWESQRSVTTSVIIYRIDPDAKAPQFHQVAKLNLNLPEVTYQLTNENRDGSAGFVHLNASSSTAIVWCSPYFVIWNWVENIGCKWNCSELSLGFKPKAFVSETGQSIVVFDEEMTRIWDIPTTRMTPQFPIVGNPAEGRVTSQIVTGTPISITTTCPWQSGPCSGRICILSDGTPCQKLYLLSIQERRVTPPVVEFVKEAECSVGDPNDTFPTTFTGTMAGLSQLDEHLAVSASSDGGEISVVFLTTSRPGTAKRRRKPPCVVRPLTDLQTIHQLKDGQLGFCAASGRIVYRSRIGQLIISDYLAPPLD